jgi:hypothetical protein
VTPQGPLRGATPGLAASLGRPTTERYRTFIEGLIEVDQQLTDDSNFLELAILAVAEVNKFIGDDQSLRLAGVSQVLRRLQAALHNKRMGANPPELSELHPNAKAPGRPTNQTHDILRGALVVGLSTLIEHGMTIREASNLLAKYCDEAGARYRGKPISASRLRQWREQVGDTSPKSTDDAVRAIQAKRPPQLGRSLPNAKQEAMGMAQLAARWNSK